MRRFIPLAAVLVAGCASTSRAADVPLSAGVFRRFASIGGNPEPSEYRGGQCTIYPEWVKIENEHGQFWVPRTSLSWIEIAPK